jgi:L-asparagine oxygenase
MSNDHSKPPSSAENQPFGEVAIAASTAEQIYATTVGLPSGLYDDDLARRGSFLEATRPTAAIIRDSELGAGLRSLAQGEIVSLTVKGLPRDPTLPMPPADGGVPVGKDTFVSEGIALAMGELLGMPSLVIGEKKEALVHQITPVAGREQTQSNEGAVSLMLHQDLAPNADLPHIPYAEFMPDWLILTGLKSGGNNQTGTYIASLDEALQHVTPEAQQILSEQKFITNPPDSFLKERGGSAPQLPIHPILSVNEEGYTEAAFDTSSNVRPVDPEDTEALKAIEELNTALTDARREVVIEPGTAVIFNNRRVVHGRGSIAQQDSTSSSEGNRWLQRVYVYDPGRVAQQAMARHLILGAGGGLLTVYLNTPRRLFEMMQASL